MNDHPVIIRNLSNPSVAPIRGKWCQSFLSRLRGFTFRSQLAPEEGLVLVESHDSRIETAIHMLFVWTDLSIAWVNTQNEVVDTVLAKAWCPFYGPAKPARYVIEYHPARYGDFQVGDQIAFDHD
ncbi:MAG: DUF192 domain-containing protein [Anaerolineales bacterium]|nr:DUF192 domain-containing protein [Anaerolineales bacterium]MCX7754195.1 DUF192 domain-containing protein [Anaerolineales bacterium]MDW8276955.1 DUF192 domain-containing protein [Anaerolineales bacterium]